MTKDIPEQEVIQFIGVKELSPEEQNTVNRLTTENFEKIKRQLNNLTNMIVHVKCYDHAGLRKKYTLSVRVIAPTQTFSSSHADDWDLPRAVHKAFDDIKHQIEHHFHGGRTRPDRG